MILYTYGVEIHYDKRIQKCLTRHVQMVLKLHDIPQELDSITPLECRLVAKCIPFMTILLMKRYGGNYKVNGPCVNVPTQLDQVLKILPRMSSEL